MVWRGAATASFGLDNSYAGERTPQIQQQNKVWVLVLHVIVQVQPLPNSSYKTICELDWLHHQQTFHLCLFFANKKPSRLCDAFGVFYH